MADENTAPIFSPEMENAVEKAHARFEARLKRGFYELQNARCSRCGEILTGKHAEGCPYPAELAEAMRPQTLSELSQLAHMAGCQNYSALAGTPGAQNVFGFPIHTDPAMPRDEIAFVHEGREIAMITNIALPGRISPMVRTPRPSLWQRIARWFRG